MLEQASKLTLTSRTFHNDALGEFAEHITRTFGYDRVLPLSTGEESRAAVIQLAQRWAYEVKGIAEAKIVVVGRAGDSKEESVPFNDLKALEVG
jgi:ornithine--oxo-acid transaminase